MKHLTTLILLFYAATSFAQASKFRFGVTMNAGISHVFISGPTVPATEYKSLEKRQAGYYGYLFARYPLTRQAQLQVGMGYSRTGFHDAVVEYAYAMPEPAFPVRGQFVFDYHDVMAPLLYRFQFKPQKASFYLVGGFTPVFNVRREKTYKAWYQDGSMTETYGVDNHGEFRRVNVNGTIGAGYSVPLGGATSFFVQPTFDCNLLGVSKAAGINRRMYLIGLNLGLVI